MDKDLGGAVAAEEEAVKAFEAMSAAKNSEIAAAGEAIESKSVRSGAPGGVEMEIGEISDPIVSGSAVHIIKLIERRGAGMQELSQTLVSHILIKPSEIRSDEESRDLSESIYRQLLQGTEFAELAKQYSDDPGTALNGGSLGWSEEGQFVPEFSEVMGKTETGQLSEPFLSPFGWHVLRVDDRRVQNISDEARREMAIDILFKRRFEEERQEWLKEIRDEAYVEIRI